MRQRTIYPVTTTIVPESSYAATMLAEGQEQLGQKGAIYSVCFMSTDLEKH